MTDRRSDPDTRSRIDEILRKIADDREQLDLQEAQRKAEDEAERSRLDALAARVDRAVKVGLSSIVIVAVGAALVIGGFIYLSSTQGATDDRARAAAKTAQRAADVAQGLAEQNRQQTQMQQNQRRGNNVTACVTRRRQNQAILGIFPPSIRDAADPKDLTTLAGPKSCRDYARSVAP